MQTTSPDYKLEINKPSRSFECKVTIGNNIYINADIVDIILETVQPQEGFSIGNTPSQTLDLTLLNRGDTIYSTSQVKVEIGLKIGSTIEYILMGYFNIDDIEKTDYTTKFTCYDNMIKFETPYFSSLTYPATLQQLANEIATKTGVQFIGSLPAAYTIKKLESFTCREILGYVASICGGNAAITRDGKFTVVYPKDINYSISADNYFDYKREEVKYKIGKVSCKTEDKELNKGSLGTDSMEIQFENPWVNESILNDIYTKLNGFSYLGYSMKWQGDLALDPGDIVAITDKKGIVRKVPILSQKFTYTGGLTTEIGAKGETKNKNSFSSSGHGSNKLDRVVTELLIVNEALIDKANIQQLEAVSIRTQSLEVKTAKVETVLSKEIFVELATAGRIVAGSSVIAEGAIGSAQISSLDVNKLNAGDISTSKIRIISEDGSIQIFGNQILANQNAKNRAIFGEYLKLDGTKDYGLLVRAKDGTTIMLDGYGVHNAGLTSDAIKDNVVADNANISGNKLDINSVIRAVNTKGTETIAGTKVTVGDRTLDVELSTQKNLIDGANKELSTQKATINAMDQAIKLKVDNQTFTQYKSTTDGNISNLNTSLNKNTASIDILQKEINLKVSQTDIDKLETKILDPKSLTKLNGMELFNQTYSSDINSKPFIAGTYTIVPCTELGLTDNKNLIRTVNGAFLKTEFIPYVPDNLYYMAVEAFNQDTTTGILYVGIEFYDKEKKSLGSNDFALYGIIAKVEDLPVNTWKTLEGYVRTDAPRNKAAFIKLRVLPRYGTTGVTYFKGFTLKQLGAYPLSIVDTKIDTKVAEIKLSLDGINLRVGKTETATATLNGQVSTLNTRVTNAESSINTFSNSISLKVNQTEFDGLQNRVGQTEVKLQPDNITSTVFTNVSEKENVVIEEICTSSSIVFSQPHEVAHENNAGDQIIGFAGADTFAQLTFIGTAVDVWTSKTDDSCIVDIYIDGVKKTTKDLYSAPFISKALIWSSGTLTKGKHTIKVVNTGRNNPSSHSNWLNFHKFSYTTDNQVLTSKSMGSIMEQLPESITIGFNKINSGKIRIDPNGLKINNGAFEIVDEEFRSMFYVRKDGLSNIGMEIGTNMATRESYIDFHSNNSNFDYDSRILCRNGSASVGNGDLEFVAKNLIYKAGYLLYSPNIRRLTLAAASNYIEVSSTSDGVWGITAWASDVRLKHSIEDTDLKALGKIMRIKHRQFNFNRDNSHVDIGYIAQELQEINPQLVFSIKQEDGTDLLNPQTSTILPLVSKALQELKIEKDQEIAALKADINLLKKFLNYKES